MQDYNYIIKFYNHKLRHTHALIGAVEREQRGVREK